MATKLTTWGQAELGAADEHGRGYDKGANHIDVRLYSIAIPGQVARRRLHKAFVSDAFRIYSTETKDRPGENTINVDINSGHFIQDAAWRFEFEDYDVAKCSVVEPLGEIDFVQAISEGFSSFTQVEFYHDEEHGDVKGTLFFTNKEATQGVASAIDANGAVLRWRFTV